MSNTNLILVTGASGKTGRRVSAILRGGGYAVREAGRSTPLPFDWECSETWGPVLQEVSAIYVVPPFGLDPQVLRAFADLAVAAGVERATLVSSADLGGAVRASRKNRSAPLA